MTFTCICCGFAQEFADEAAAYTAGWDTPAYFHVGPLCDLCPSAHVVMNGLAAARRRHAGVHQKWATQGRPAAFNVLDEYEADGMTAEEIQESERSIARLKELIDDYHRRRVH